MTAIRLFLLRHGQSLANEQCLIASKPATAQDAFGLLPLGRAQVRRSLEEAQGAGLLKPPFRLVSSPLLRTGESIDIAAALLGVTSTVDPGLSERDFGELELKPDDQYEQVWAKDRLDPTHRSWGVQSVADVLTRAAPVVNGCLGLDDAETVILCTHGDVASILLCSSLGEPLGQHREVGALETGELRELTSRVG